MSHPLYTEEERLAHIAAREATINRAIAYIETSPLDDVYDVVNLTSIHQHLKDDPTALVEALRRHLGTDHTFGAWKAAQQICRAVGLEH